jgi:superfamily II DNA or RNA helicase
MQKTTKTMEKITLRDYQEEGIDNIKTAFNKKHKRVLFVQPTGTGKTVMFADMVAKAAQIGNTSIIVVPRVHLITQTAKKLEEFGIKVITIRESKKKLIVEAGQVLVDTEKTIANRLKSGLLEIDPKFIIIDEAHHSEAKTHQKIISYFPKSFLLGMTATPIRLDGKGFENTFDKIIQTHPYSYFLERNIIAAPVYYNKQMDINLAEIKITKNDFNEQELSAIVTKDENIAHVFKNYNQCAYGKKFIAFAVDTIHGEELCKEFNAYGINARCIFAYTSEKERVTILNEFKEGNIVGIFNVDVFSEGFDCPDIDCVILARPTKSLSKYIQQVGRGLRNPNQGVKREVIVLDCAGNNTIHNGSATEDRFYTLKGEKKQAREVSHHQNLDVAKEGKEVTYVDVNLSQSNTALWNTELNRLADLVVKHSEWKPATLFWRFNKYLYDNHLKWTEEMIKHFKLAIWAIIKDRKGTDYAYNLEYAPYLLASIYKNNLDPLDSGQMVIVKNGFKPKEQDQKLFKPAQSKLNATNSIHNSLTL